MRVFLWALVALFPLACMLVYAVPQLKAGALFILGLVAVVPLFGQAARGEYRR